MTSCEKCSAIFSRKKCLHQNCPSHREELAAFQKEIDEHIENMVVQAWHPRTKAPEVQASKTKNNNVVSRIQSPNNHYHSAQTSGIHHSPGKNKAAGDIPPRNHKQTFSTPAAPPNDKALGILLPAQPPIFSSTRSSNGRAPLLQSGGSGFNSPRVHSREQQTNTRL